MKSRGAGIVAVLVLGAAPALGQPMTAVERQRLLAHLEMTSGWLRDEVSGLSRDQVSFKPSQDAWSVREVLEHLVLVAPIYWDDLQDALKAPPTTMRSAFTDADILWYGIDRGRREKAIPSEVPKGKPRELSALLAEYQRHHDRLVEYVQETNDPLRAHMVPRQGSDAYQWALLITTHEQRHILQIRELKRAKRFPQ